MGAGEEGEDAVPTLEMQPSMVCVDMTLAPGESRTCACPSLLPLPNADYCYLVTYTVNLPDCLPPTFKGRAFRFSYQLVVGTCRSLTPFVPHTSVTPKDVERRRSRVMRVPIRVYNHVAGEL